MNTENRKKVRDLYTWLIELEMADKGCLKCNLELRGTHLQYLFTPLLAKAGINFLDLFEVELTNQVREMGIDPNEFAKRVAGLEYKKGNLGR